MTDLKTDRIDGFARTAGSDDHAAGESTRHGVSLERSRATGRLLRFRKAADTARQTESAPDLGFDVHTALAKRLDVSWQVPAACWSASPGATRLHQASPGVHVSEMLQGQKNSQSGRCSVSAATPCSASLPRVRRPERDALPGGTPNENQ